jgi:hypothetical protein
MKNNIKTPCNFDHNGECLICDCWSDACAYDRMLNKDYKYESKEELEEMFKNITNRIMVGKLLKTEKGHYILIDDTKGTYDKGLLIGTSRNSDVNKLSIKNCESIERGYDLDGLAKVFHEQHKFASSHIADITSFKLGFQKALKILGDKKFSEDDITSAMNRVWDWCEMQEDEECSSMTELRDKHFKSLQQTEWEVEIEMEPYYDGEFIDDGKTHIVEAKWRPKFDEDGCLILKRI